MRVASHRYHDSSRTLHLNDVPFRRFGQRRATEAALPPAPVIGSTVQGPLTTPPLAFIVMRYYMPFPIAGFLPMIFNAVGPDSLLSSRGCEYS